MKYIVYEDDDGFIRRVLVKDDDTESEAEFGLPAGPPDVRALDWELMMKQVNNSLAENGIFTWDDAQRSPIGIQAALTLFKRNLITLFKAEHAPQKKEW